MSHAIIDDAEMFAEDLLIFVMKESSRRASSRNLRPCCSSSPLTTSIQFAVRLFLEQREETIRNIFNALLDQGDLNRHFRSFASTMAVLVTVRGYSDLDFVVFSAVICKLAVLAFANNYKTCLSHAVTAIIEAVRLFKLTGAFTSDTWDKMSRTVLFNPHSICLL